MIIQEARFTEKDYTPEELVDLPQIRAILDFINHSEGSGAGYGTIVKGLVKKSPFYPELVGQRNVTITDFSRFPEILVDFGADWSSAAGRYQITSITWKDFGKGDFSPRSQDLAAMRIMIAENMIEPLMSGNIRQAIYNGGKRRWASFPMNEQGQSFASGQHAKPISEMESKYNEFLAKY